MAALFFKPVGNFFCPEDRPSPIFSTWSVAMNVLGIAWGIIRLAVGSGTCSGATRTWLILGLISHIAPIAFGVYIYMRFAKKVKEGKRASEAAWKLLMYDWGVCTFFLFLIWLLVWLIVAGGKAKNENSACADQINVSVVLFILWGVVGVILIFFSLFTECCRTPKWARHGQTSPRVQQAAQQTQAQRAQPMQPVGSSIIGGTAGPAPPPPGGEAPPQVVYGVPVSPAGTQAAPPAQNPNYRV